MIFSLRKRQQLTVKLNVFILSLLPLILIFIGYFLKKGLGNYFLYSVDPEYSYLLNGLNLVHFNFPWHIDHPGTPLQVISAIVIHIVHLFHNYNIPIDRDVFSCPEIYLNAIVAVINIINGIALFTLGYVVCKKTLSLTLALYFQLMPFVSFTVLSILNRVIVEQLFIVNVIFLILILFLYLKNENFKTVLIDKYLIFFSIIVGLGMAMKITFSPLFLIPLIMLPGFIRKTLYAFFTIASFSFFAFPVFAHWVPFRDWIENLFLHSGFYGKGAENIIEPGIFITNLNYIFKTEYIFPIAFLIIMLGCILYYLPIFKVRKKDDMQFKCLVGIALSMILMVLMVAKQFKYFYLTPILLLVVPGLYLIIAIYSRQIKFLNNKLVVVVLFIVFLFLVYHFEVRNAFTHKSFLSLRNEYYTNTQRIIEKEYKDRPVLILAKHYGAPYREYGLFFGTIWCGEEMRNIYFATLTDLYPHTYLYDKWNDVINGWKYNYSLNDLMKKHNNLIIYTDKSEFEKILHDKFAGACLENNAKLNKVFFNEQTGESIFEIK